MKNNSLPLLKILRISEAPLKNVNLGDPQKPIVFCKNAKKHLQGPTTGHDNPKGHNSLKKFPTSRSSQSLLLFDLIYLFGKVIWEYDSQKVSHVISNLQTWIIYCDLRISNKLIKHLSSRSFLWGRKRSFRELSILLFENNLFILTAGVFFLFKNAIENQR